MNPWLRTSRARFGSRSGSKGFASRSLGALAAQVAAACGSRPPGPAPGRRRAFTLLELLVVMTIMVALAATSVPVLGVMRRDMRLGAASARLKAGLIQTRNLLTDYPLPDFTLTVPVVPGAAYTGTGLAVRWDDTLQDYDVFHIISTQTARHPSLKNNLRAGLNDTSNNARGYLLSAGPTPAGDYTYRGYSVFQQLEPMTLGSDVRVAGLRRRAGAGAASPDGPTELEIVSDNNGGPVSSFVICMDTTGIAIPPAKAVYINMQEAPPDAASRPVDSPWNVWDTTMYDAPAANTGAHASQYVRPGPTAATAGVGEGFFTALPIILVYCDSDLPASGNAPSGKPWRVANAKGALVLNPALDPNEVLVQTHGRLVMLSLQGNAPLEY